MTANKGASSDQTEVTGSGAIVAVAPTKSSPSDVFNWC